MMILTIANKHLTSQTYPYMSVEEISENALSTAHSSTSVMEGISDFLKSSTIHGVAYISTTRRHGRLFWITVVTASFIGSGFMIYQSFKDWHRNPVKTTIETTNS